MCQFLCLQHFPIVRQLRPLATSKWVPKNPLKFLRVNLILVYVFEYNFPYHTSQFPYHTIPLKYEIVSYYKYEMARSAFSRVLLPRILPVRRKHLRVWVCFPKFLEAWNMMGKWEKTALWVAFKKCTH